MRSYEQSHYGGATLALPFSLRLLASPRAEILKIMREQDQFVYRLAKLGAVLLQDVRQARKITDEGKGLEGTHTF